MEAHSFSGGGSNTTDMAGDSGAQKSAAQHTKAVGKPQEVAQDGQL